VQNLVYVFGGVVVALVVTWPQRHQAAGRNIFDVAIERGQHALGGRGGKRRALRIDKTIHRIDDGSGAERHGPVECRVNVFGFANVEGVNLDAKFAGLSTDHFELSRVFGIVAVEEHRDLVEFR
jgi:hypothetical protein